MQGNEEYDRIAGAIYNVILGRTVHVVHPTVVLEPGSRTLFVEEEVYYEEPEKVSIYKNAGLDEDFVTDPNKFRWDLAQSELAIKEMTKTKCILDRWNARFGGGNNAV